MFKWALNIVLALVIFNVSTLQAKTYVQETKHVKVNLHTQFDALNSQQTLGVILEFDIADGWHIFSENPGEIGMPTTISWKENSKYKVLEGYWSPDKEFENEGFVQRGFSDKAYYQTALVPNKNNENRYDLEVNIKWLACKGECYPEQANFIFSLENTELEQLETDGWKNIFAKAQRAFDPKENKINVAYLLLMAFLGGIIMNIMPCVFPILAIKIVNLLNNKTNKKQQLFKAISYFFGVVLSFVVLAIILWILKHIGQTAGWGFQLQSPWFVGFMALLFIIIGLMLLDVFGVDFSFVEKYTKNKNYIVASFLSGLLAVLIASSCTAPLMGVAIGYALGASTNIYFAVFVALGAGYALPFSLIELFPQAIRKLMPKSGKWMNIFKKLLSVPVFLTALWLLWVLYGQLVPQKQANLMWQDYDAQKIDQLVKMKKPVFIDFTAKWCLTCVINKKTTLQSREFEKLAQQKEIKLFVADWTNNDPEIAKALEYYQRSSVPLYVYYNGEDEKFEILPSILTIKIINDRIK